MWPGKIVIVGGGTAGWLAAMMLGDSAKRGGHACQITVIESSKIGTIGVGEGTTAVFRQMLQHFGLDEMEFLAETGATIKFGIRHRDWRRLGHSYDGPIDDPHRVTGFEVNALDLYQVSRGESVGQVHLFQHLLSRNKSPFADVEGRRVAVGPFTEAHMISLENLAELGHKAPGGDAMTGALLPIETVLDGIPALAIDEEQARRLKLGQAVLLRGANAPIAEDAVLVMSGGKPLGIGTIVQGSLKPKRLFSL